MSGGILERAPSSLLRSSGGLLAAASRSLSTWSRTVRFHAASRAFVPRHDDIYVASYPRSGTTWTQLIVYFLITKAEGADFAHISDVAPWWERSLAWRPQSAAEFESLPGPRIFKTHLRARWLPRAGRVIYLVRDEEPVCLSYYRLYQDYLGYKGTIESFVDAFSRGQVQYGGHREHIRAWADARTEREVLWLRYEDQLADPQRGIRRIAEFLDLDVSAARVTEIARLTSLDAMRAQQYRFDHIGELCRQWGIRGDRFVGGGDDCAEKRAKVGALLEQCTSRQGGSSKQRLSNYLY